MSSIAAAQVSHRDRLVTAAARFTAENGWAELTMAKLADLVGVSRQTVYNEIGGKPQLAEAMVLRELELFLQVVDSAFYDNPDDLVARDRGGLVPGARAGQHRPAAARHPQQQPGCGQRAAPAADDELGAPARELRPR